MTRKGYYEKDGAEGPYSVGKWSTWKSACRTGGPTSNHHHPARAPAHRTTRMGDERLREAEHD